MGIITMLTRRDLLKRCFKTTVPKDLKKADAISKLITPGLLGAIVKVNNIGVLRNKSLTGCGIFNAYGRSIILNDPEKVRDVTLTFNPKDRSTLNRLRTDFQPNYLWICTGPFTIRNREFILYNPRYEPPIQKIINTFEKQYMPEGPITVDSLKKIIEMLSS